jgi:hypothetical protein
VLAGFISIHAEVYGNIIFLFAKSSFSGKIVSVATHAGGI